ncbi:hypothetical protein ACEN9J_03165 [Variovorax sp. Varisp41]|uniref:hypothetical protein n=1 Tax=Variovorax sp. Varisp41 TaxID=3243033 RepID=UPI0039B38828
MNFDISAIEQSANVVHEVLVGHLPDGPEGAPGTKVGFRVVGPASDQYQAVDREIQIVNVRDAVKQRATLDLKTDKGAELVVDTGADRRLRIVRACTVGWYGFKDGGQDFPFTPENLDRMLKARPNWVNRLIAAIEDEANFAGA